MNIYLLLCTCLLAKGSITSASIETGVTFNFNGTITKADANKQNPTGIAVAWFNLLDDDSGDPDQKWRLTDGVTSMLNENDFSYSMEANQEQLDRSLAEHSLEERSASFWAKRVGIPANELTTKIKVAMGTIIGTYQPYDKAQYFFGNDYGLKRTALEDVQGPSGEIAVSENYMAFYVNKTVPVEFWIHSHKASAVVRQHPLPAVLGLTSFSLWTVLKLLSKLLR